MEENNNVIEQLSEVEELESKLAPGVGAGPTTIHVNP